MVKTFVVEEIYPKFLRICILEYDQLNAPPPLKQLAKGLHRLDI